MLYRSMATIAVLAAVFTTSAQAAPPSWVSIADDNEGGGVMIDVANVSFSGGQVLAWYMINFPPAKQKNGTARHISRIKVDCTKEQISTMSYTALDKNGASVLSHQAPIDEWIDVAPGSIGRSMMDAACLLKEAGKK